MPRAGDHVNGGHPVGLLAALVSMLFTRAWACGQVSKRAKSMPAAASGPRYIRAAAGFLRAVEAAGGAYR